nr:MAG TPA_asm: hypothetical protein [Caudoviricetes sp.]
MRRRQLCVTYLYLCCWWLLLKWHEIIRKGGEIMNNLILECIEAIEDDMDDGYLVDEDSRLKYALSYLANDDEISELYELIKTGKAPGAGKQSGT